MAEIQREDQEFDIKPLKIISAKVSNYVYDCFEQMKREMKIDTNDVALRFLLEIYKKYQDDLSEVSSKGDSSDLEKSCYAAASVASPSPSEVDESLSMCYSEYSEVPIKQELDHFDDDLEDFYKSAPTPASTMELPESGLCDMSEMMTPSLHYQKTCGDDSYEVPFCQYQSSETSYPSPVPSMRYTQVPFLYRHLFLEKAPYQMGVNEPGDDVKEEEYDDDDDPEEEEKVYAPREIDMKAPDDDYQNNANEDDDDDPEDPEGNKQFQTGRYETKGMLSDDETPQKEKPAASYTLPLKIKCKLCNELLPDKEDMKRHVISEHSNQHFPMPKRHKDRVVREKMGNVDESISDYEVSALLTRMRRCPMCNEYVPERGVVAHQERHGRLDIMCELCGEVFSNKGRLKSHKANMHDNELHQCGECGKSYTSKRRLQSHKGRHKKYICEICGKETPSKGAYGRHKVTHLVVKPYQCSECGKGFSQNNNLKSHMRVHTGVKPFRCDLCPQAFTHNVSLKTHKKKTHGIDMWVANSDQGL
ncbi:uncharacterized protein [Amphiura filiformis]|uniref:uncharacterized protein n=1 Tax=Amphiura filiformis TaxID=82378 RepID=UPI003B225F0A